MGYYCDKIGAMPRDIRFIFILLLGACVLTLPCRISQAQSSFIETILHKKKAIVQVTAFDQEIIGNQIRRTHQNGAGAILNGNGLIITNLHVLQYKTYIRVTLSNGSKHNAKLITILPGADLALIQIDSNEPLETITMADSNKVRLNDRIVHIGNSHFIKNTISEGKITGIGRTHKGAQDIEILQTNLSLYEGDSGGPLINENGELIGLINAQLKNKHKSVFAIPSNKIRNIYRKYENELYNR